MGFISKVYFLTRTILGGLFWHWNYICIKSTEVIRIMEATKSKFCFKLLSDNTHPSIRVLWRLRYKSSRGASKFMFQTAGSWSGSSFHRVASLRKGYFGYSWDGNFLNIQSAWKVWIFFHVVKRFENYESWCGQSSFIVEDGNSFMVKFIIHLVIT